MSFADIPKPSEFEPDHIMHEQEVVAERQAHARDLIEKLSDSAFAVRHRFLRLVSLPSDKTKTLIEVLTTERDSVAVERSLHSTIAAVSFERGNDLRFDFLTEKFHSRKTDGVMEALLYAGGTTALGDLARMVRSEDPIAAVLSLVSRCVLSVDLSKPINGETQVALFDPLAL